MIRKSELQQELGNVTARLKDRIIYPLQKMKDELDPLLVWLSGSNAGLPGKGSLIRFQVRAHARVEGQVPNGVARERQPHIDVSPTFFLPPSF